MALKYGEIKSTKNITGQEIIYSIYNLKVDCNLTKINKDPANFDSVKDVCEVYLEEVHYGFQKTFTDGSKNMNGCEAGFVAPDKNRSSKSTLSFLNSTCSAELTVIQECVV